jgi:hypothetical protein
LFPTDLILQKILRCYYRIGVQNDSCKIYVSIIKGGFLSMRESNQAGY